MRREIPHFIQREMHICGGVIAGCGDGDHVGIGSAGYLSRACLYIVVIIGLALVSVPIGSGAGERKMDIRTAACGQIGDFHPKPNILSVRIPNIQFADGVCKSSALGFIQHPQPRNPRHRGLGEG